MVNVDSILPPLEVPFDCNTYGCSDTIDGICILSSPSCRQVNVMDISNLTSQRKPSHGHSHYESNILHDVSLNNLLFIQKPLGMQHTLETKFTTPLKTTLLVQLMFGKPRYKSEFKSIQAYRHCFGYCTSRPFQTCWNYEE